MVIGMLCVIKIVGNNLRKPMNPQVIAHQFYSTQHYGYMVHTKVQRQTLRAFQGFFKALRFKIKGLHKPRENFTHFKSPQF